MLKQLDGRTNKPCQLTFFSRVLNKSEENHSTLEQEALAIAYGLKTNRPLILGFPMLVCTDHRSLVWLLIVSNPSRLTARWQIPMAEFGISIQYLLGKSDVVTDAVGCLRKKLETECVLTVAKVKMTDQLLPDVVISWDLTHIIDAQDRDQIWGVIRRMITQGKKLDSSGRYLIDEEGKAVSCDREHPDVRLSETVSPSRP